MVKLLVRCSKMELQNSKRSLSRPLFGSKRVPALQELEVLQVSSGDCLVLSNVVEQVGDEAEEPDEHSDHGQQFAGSPH